MRLLTLILLFYATSLIAETIDLSKAQSSKLEWVAIGNPGFLKIGSKNASVTGELHIDNGMLSGEFLTHLDDMKTGMKLRDDHMKEKYLQTKEYPDAKFTLKPVKVASSFVAQGTMSLHGKEKDMTWDCQAAKADTRKISCVGTLLLTDFDIKIPTYMGVTIAKEVKVKVVLVL